MNSREQEKPDPNPDFSVTHGGRLVAYIYSGGAGEFRRAGKSANVLREVPYAEVLSFEPKHEALIASLLEKSADLDTFLFKLELEEFDVFPGRTEPRAHHRRF